MDEYEIPIHGLTEGIHNYNFEIKTSFFEFYCNPDLPGGDLKVDLCINKKVQFLEFDFHLTGILDLVCDRCLEVFAFKIDIKEKLFLRFGNKFEELDDNIIVIPREESRFNISQYLYEFAALSIPYKKVHSESQAGESGCNPEMIKRLNELKVEEKIETIDPRWDKLKKLN